MPEFAVFRNGSNSANQHMTQRMLVWSGEARDDEDAKLRARRGGTKVYNNQYLDAILAEELDGEDYAEYHQAKEVVHLQPFNIPSDLHSAMKAAAQKERKSLKDWRIEAYREKLYR